jgi:glycosyltransferase involved in cell wall biosynthesis
MASPVVNPSRARRIVAVAPVDHPGGAETTLLRLLRQLAGRGWETVLTTPGAGPLRAAARADGHGWRALPIGGLGRGTGARAVLAWPLARHLAATADVIYLNGAVCGRLLPALPAGRGRRVLHVHDIVQRLPPFWRRADVVLAASEAVAARLTGLPVEVVYGPVDPDPPAAPPPWPPADGTRTATGPIVGFVGRVEPRKGVADLVAAAPLIRSGAPGARVVVVGDDPYATDPAYTAAVIGSPEIEHVPWVDNAPGVMRHLDVLVLPSHQEPFGTVLAEAMAVGTPVVATRVGGLAEVVRDGVTGRLVAPGDPAALAAAVLEVLGARAAMSAAAREHARRFHTETYADRVEALISPVRS